MLKGTKVLEQEDQFIKLNEKLDLEAQGLLKQLHQAINQNEENIHLDVPLESEKGCLNGEMDENSGWNLRNKDDQQIHKKPFVSSVKDGGKNDRAPVLALPHVTPNLVQTPKLTRHKSEVVIKERLDLGAGTVPEAVKNLGNESVMRFLKAKVQILTEQLENMKKDEKKMIEKVKDLQSDKERVSEDRDKWIQQANMAKNMLLKHEHQASDLVVQLQSCQAENGYLKKELEKVKKDFKQMSQGAGSNEVRLNRANEEMERLKNSLKQMKQEEKDLRESQKKKIEDMSLNLKRIEKQKIELLHAFKKQLIVIDGLKKQRGLAEAGKILKAIEDDFMEFLDWNPNKN